MYRFGTQNNLKNNVKLSSNIELNKVVVLCTAYVVVFRPHIYGNNKNYNLLRIFRVNE